MSKKKSKRAFTEPAYKTCPICYVDFLPVHANHVYCRECRECRKPEIRHHQAMKLREAQLKAARAVSRIPLIEDIVAEMKAYNAKHGTNYDYGYYVGLRDNGWLKE